MPRVTRARVAKERSPECDPRALAGLSLMDAIPVISPELASPWHLAPLVELLEKAPGGGVRVLSSPPIRHAKTTTLIHAIVWWLARDPTLKVWFLSYSAQYAQLWSRTCRLLAESVGVRL